MIAVLSRYLPDRLTDACRLTAAARAIGPALTPEREYARDAGGLRFPYERLALPCSTRRRPRGRQFRYGDPSPRRSTTRGCGRPGRPRLSYGTQVSSAGVTISSWVIARGLWLL